jgi:Listeria-Bacteroides repeat domain (List_Bact_rpt).
MNAGSWNIVVNGIDASNNCVVTGSTTVTVVAGQTTTASVDLSPYTSGSGTLSLGLSWPSDKSVDAVSATLSTVSGTIYKSIDLTMSTSSASYSASDITPGAYLLAVTAKNGGAAVARTLVESILIYNGGTSTGSLSLTADDFGSIYSVIYDGNGASGTAPTDSRAYITGSTATVLGNTSGLSKNGCTFAGWNTKSDGTGTSYAAGGTITIGSSSVTLYAQWITNGATITVTAPGTVTLTLSISASMLSAGTAISASVAASATVDSYAWYLDGSLVSGQSTSSFSGGTSLARGPHTLMAVAMKNGVAYSASSLVTVQ